MAKEECLSKEEIINHVAYFNIFDCKKLKHSIETKDDKTFEINLRFMLPSSSSLFLLETSI